MANKRFGTRWDHSFVAISEVWLEKFTPEQEFLNFAGVSACMRERNVIVVVNGDL